MIEDEKTCSFQFFVAGVYDSGAEKGGACCRTTGAEKDIENCRPAAEDKNTANFFRLLRRARSRWLCRGRGSDWNFDFFEQFFDRTRGLYVGRGGIYDSSLGRMREQLFFCVASGAGDVDKFLTRGG